MSFSNKESAPVLSLIKDIKDGRCNPKTLDKELRQQCVEVFLTEGYSKAQMAQILGRSEKTIKRDMNEIYLSNYLNSDHNLLKVVIGRLMMAINIHRNHLMKLARVKGSSVSEKTQAELFAFKVLTEGISKLQSLGYLPLQPQAVIGEVSLNVSNDSEKSYQDLQADISELEKLHEDTGDMPVEIKNEIEKLKQSIAKASIESEIKQLEHKAKEVNNDIS